MIREFDEDRHESKDIANHKWMTTILSPDERVSICGFPTVTSGQVTIFGNRMNKDHLGV